MRKVRLSSTVVLTDYGPMSRSMGGPGRTIVVRPGIVTRVNEDGTVDGVKFALPEDQVDGHSWGFSGVRHAGPAAAGTKEALFKWQWPEDEEAP